MPEYECIAICALCFSFFKWNLCSNFMFIEEFSRIYLNELYVRDITVNT